MFNRYYRGYGGYGGINTVNVHAVGLRKPEDIIDNPTNRLYGDLNLMSIPDILQWVHMNKKTGTLIAHNGDSSKSIYVQEGNIIYISSREPGERIGEILAEMALLSKDNVEEHIKTSQLIKVPFISYLIDGNIVRREDLVSALEKTAVRIIINIMKWLEGWFEFTTDIPEHVLNGPIRLNVASVTMESLRAYDELNRDRSNTGNIVAKELIETIVNGRIRLPEISEELLDIQRRMKSRIITINDVVNIIVSDERLSFTLTHTIKKLYYDMEPGKSITVHDAVVLLGVRNVMSFVTMHFAMQTIKSDREKAKQIFCHSLLCAFVAKKIVMNSSINANETEVFSCALLHDIGRLIMADIVSGYPVSEDVAARITDQYHDKLGALAAYEWNFGEAALETVRHHHNPSNSKTHSELVEIVALANDIAKDNLMRGVDLSRYKALKVNEINLGQIYYEMDNARRAIREIEHR
ncbi:MAG: HDOD domain-containing protein [Thermodesulfovibrionales bacterium]